MQHVVITGSTRGIGFGLACAVLERGCTVTISGRTHTGVEAALARLPADQQPDRIQGVPCDVRRYAEVQALWDRSVDRFGKVDMWVSNAGISPRQNRTWEVPPEEISSVVETNMLGAIFSSTVAVRGMLEQGYGSVYIMEGMGSDGRRHDGLAYYGMTKYGLKYFIQSLVDETRGLPVLVGSIRPGMVVTEFVTDAVGERPQMMEQTRRIMNILADRVEVVAPWIADEILSNRKHGVTLTRLNRWQITWRFLLAPFRKRDVFEAP
jgi:NAD(P)-dependent dehydrogenase (short-subunit alcohol dehydrogenase family)